MRQIANAKIRSTFLGYEDHGIMTIYLDLEYGGSAGQSFGGYGLDTFVKSKEDRVPTEACGMMIKEILNVVGVKKWEDLPGKYIRVDSEMAKVHRIGNLLEDKWFDPQKILR